MATEFSSGTQKMVLILVFDISFIASEISYHNRSLTLDLDLPISHQAEWRTIECIYRQMQVQCHDETLRLWQREGAKYLPWYRDFAFGFLEACRQSSPEVAMLIEASTRSSFAESFYRFHHIAMLFVERKINFPNYQDPDVTIAFRDLEDIMRRFLLSAAYPPRNLDQETSLPIVDCHHRRLYDARQEEDLASRMFNSSNYFPIEACGTLDTVAESRQNEAVLQLINEKLESLCGSSVIISQT